MLKGIENILSVDDDEAYELAPDTVVRDSSIYK